PPTLRRISALDHLRSSHPSPTPHPLHSAPPPSPTRRSSDLSARSRPPRLPGTRRARRPLCRACAPSSPRPRPSAAGAQARHNGRSEEHTSELQSPDHLACRLLLEKKKKTKHQRSKYLSRATP